MKLNRLILLGSLLAVGSMANAQISGSDHDFSGETWNPGAEICAPCHTPHNAATSVAGFSGLLWNHDLTTATFQMYTSATLDGAIDAGPGGTSLMCLSCHDGTVGLGDFGGASHATTMGGSALIGTDLRGEHPISIVYNVADIELNPISSGLGGGAQLISDVLEGGKVECSSCHDVHNSPNEAFGSKLLRGTMAGSALCLDCHNK